MPNTIQAAGEAMPKHKPSNVLIDIKRHNLELLSMHDLNVVLAGFNAARDAINGVECQPRCVGAANDEISAMQDSLNDVIDMIVSVAKAAKPTDKTEATIRCYLILHSETTYYDHFDLIEETVASLRADMAPFRKGEQA